MGEGTSRCYTYFNPKIKTIHLSSCKILKVGPSILVNIILALLLLYSFTTHQHTCNPHAGHFSPFPEAKVQSLEDINVQLGYQAIVHSS